MMQRHLRKRIPVGALLVLLSLLPGGGSGRTGALTAQGLADYDYENLGLRGVSGWTSYLWPSTVEPVQGFGGRLDLGYLGPGIRILPTFARWESDFRREEIATLERRIEELVARDQDPALPAPSVDLGTVQWSGMVLGLDGQVVWSLPIPLLTYVGAGFAAHLLNGEGEAVEGTFVEDLLDRVAFGGNVHGGVEWILGNHVRWFAEARGELLEQLRYGEIRSGFSLMFQRPAPGELR